MTKASRQLSLILWGFAAGLAALAMVAYGILPGGGRPGVPAIGGSFSLTAQDGHVVTDRDLVGRPYLVFFGYTHCPDYCPTALYDISRILAAMGSDKKIAVLFVTVDPERDTPELLKSYLESFDSRIIGLTGDKAKTEAIAKAFRVYFQKVPGENGEYTVDHTAAVYLMDKTGRFVSAINLAIPAQQAARELERYL